MNRKFKQSKLIWHSPKEETPEGNVGILVAFRDLVDGTEWVVESYYDPDEKGYAIFPKQDFPFDIRAVAWAYWPSFPEEKKNSCV